MRQSGVVSLGTIACNVGLVVLELSMIGELVDPYALLWKYYLSGTFSPYFKYSVQYPISYWALS
jgi:cytochrome b6-f complex subunit 4